MTYRFAYISLVAAIVGCRGPAAAPRSDSEDAKPTATTSIEQEIEMDPMFAREPKPLGNFLLTFYFVIGEDEVGPKKSAPVELATRDAGDTELAAITTRAKVGIFDARGCKEITQVAPEFAFQLAVQGSGRLRDGRLLSVSGHCKCGRSPCYSVTKNPWGTSGTSRPLQPFRTVAVDPKVVRLGTLLHIPALEGRMMPGRAPWGGFVHDGCVIADDTGGNIDGKQLDLFVGRKAYFYGLARGGSSHAWASNVPVYDGSAICERKGRQVGRRIDSI